MMTTRQGLSSAAIERLIAQHVADAIAAYEANRSNGNATQNEASGSAVGVENTARGSSYKAFLNCQPRNFVRTEGLVGLTRWFEKMESVFRISNCATDCQVNFATCTLLDGALTWWNSHVKTVRIDEAHEMSWKDLMKLMIKVYFPRNKIQNLENDLWNLTVKGTDVAGYTQRFQELAFFCPKMVLDEEEKIKRYI
ncbi:reverse transcriptase domain-containing protein [Tanacetum coccineum]